MQGPSHVVDHDRLCPTLGTVRRRGDFFVSGTTELLAPLLEVDGVGPITPPLLPIQAEQLVAVAQRAPFGRGEETLADRAVRRTWQIAADRVRIRGKHWTRTAGDHPGVGGRWARGRRTGSSPTLQAAGVRPGQLLRQSSRHRKDPRDVRHAGDRAAVNLRRGRATKVARCGSTCAAPTRQRRASRRSMPTAFTRCCRSPTVARCPWSII